MIRFISLLFSLLQNNNSKNSVHARKRGGARAKKRSEEVLFFFGNEKKLAPLEKKKKRAHTLTGTKKPKGRVGVLAIKSLSRLAPGVETRNPLEKEHTRHANKKCSPHPRLSEPLKLRISPLRRALRTAR